MNQQTQDYRKMPIVHQQVAGVDIGSQFHVVAIGDDPTQHVQQFGVSTKELFRLADWLRGHEVRHVAMEATGGYERPLVNVLQEAGFDVLVTAGANTKNYRRFNGAARAVRHLGCHPHPYPPQFGSVAAHLSARRVFDIDSSLSTVAEKSGRRCC
ncbi:IS110 family transposase [Spirosoma fluminis]